MSKAIINTDFEIAGCPLFIEVEIRDAEIIKDKIGFILNDIIKDKCNDYFNRNSSPKPQEPKEL